MTDERIWLGRVFYVWSNIYSFFTVSIFWVLVINLLEIFVQEITMVLLWLVDQ